MRWCLQKIVENPGLADLPTKVLAQKLNVKLQEARRAKRSFRNSQLTNVWHNAGLKPTN